MSRELVWANRAVRTSVMPAVATLAASLVALGILVDSSTTALGVGAVAIGAAGLANHRLFLRAFLASAASLLLGYAFLGKGLAYVGAGGIYVGDMILALGLMALVVSGALVADGWTRVGWPLLAFMGWGVLRTVPYLEAYRLDALRDAVVWIYALYALLISAGLLSTGWWRRVPSLYAAAIPWLLIWLPIVFALSRIAGDVLPSWPGASVSFVYLKPGDVAVHLAGVASFLLLRPTSRAPGLRSVRAWLQWVLWIVMFLVVASQNRGGMLAVFCSLVVTCWFLSPRRWLPLVLPGTLLVGMLIAFGVQLQVGGSRVISPEQVFHNALSVLGVDDRLELSATREWRLQWWTKIVDYTVHGDHFWGGKGFGINLARDDGYDTSGAFPLRSPHNGHVTILARTGVPGFVLWVVMQGTLLVALARAAIRARRLGNDRRAASHAWVLAYLVAFLVNMSFDVFLEGPQGGIWFWCVWGLGIALVEVERRERRQAAMRAAMSRRWS